jgi:squalene-hopene/tetraprenyl-beta-curcumene cyclase
VSDVDREALTRAINRLAGRLLDRRAAPDHWVGNLASSALSTGTAVLAMEIAARNHYPGRERLRQMVGAGTAWLTRHQNSDGGWGDTVRSRSNISTTAIVWAALSSIAAGDVDARSAIERSETWLRQAAGGTTADALRSAIIRRYGKDQTFSVPILTVLALAGKLGADPASAWRSVPQLPFELAALPHAWFQHLQLPVVSYALPALIAIGQVRHHFAPSRNLPARALRDGVRERTHRVLRDMQPDSGGYLEATPLTSFVVMSLAGMGRADSPVVANGVRFLVESMRPDGSWPIDTHLATWVTTLSVGALADAGLLPAADTPAMHRWLRNQQSTREHPFTHAKPGAWAWTPLSGGVPDADDTAGALLALRQLREPAPGDIDAAAAGIRWLTGVQNRDGGIPTFCRGWGTLPFDRSTPEITAHALQAWSAWYPHADSSLQRMLRRVGARAVAFLASSQRPNGSWIPLWFGNEDAPHEDNPVYGTARVLLGLQSELVSGSPRAATCRLAGVEWLTAAQNADGGWGGSRDVPSTIEETGIALSALGRSVADGDHARVSAALASGIRWLVDATDRAEITAAPLGLYFARLWYFEELYPVVFALSGLATAKASARAGATLACSQSQAPATVRAE